MQRFALDTYTNRQLLGMIAAPEKHAPKETRSILKREASELIRSRAKQAARTVTRHFRSRPAKPVVAQPSLDAVRAGL